MMRHFKPILSKSIAILFGIAIILSFQLPEDQKVEILKSSQKVVDLRLEALQILKTKCNVCHEKKNPRRVFNLENMSDLAPKIYKQVFVKRRMPKGNEIQLSDKEYNTLKQWLLTKKIF